MVFQEKSGKIRGADIMSNTDNAIVVKNLHKTFRLPHESHSGVKQLLLNLFKKNRKKGYETQHVLKGIDFEIKKGDFFGIVGRNGSGKSTLLKTLAGIYTPDSGGVEVNGSLIPFIELGVGFNPELTGRENVFLNGALLGFSQSEMEAMYDDIVEFAELEKFMDQKLKNYSSGMQIRLAFSIAIRADTDILLLDEVLAVGDEAFQQKCFEYFGQLKRQKKTVILVTHDMGAVEKFCNKAILLEKGLISKEGTNIEVAQQYRKLFTDDIGKDVEESNKKAKSDAVGIYKKDLMDEVSLEVMQNGKRVSTIKSGESFEINLSFVAKKDLGLLASGINIINTQNIIVMASGFGALKERQVEGQKGRHVIRFAVKENVLTNDVYSIDIAIATTNEEYVQTLIYQAKGVQKFSSRGVETRAFAVAHPEITLEQEHYYA